MALDSGLAEALRRHFKGEVLTDEATLRAYSMDASPYLVRPQAVVRPRDRNAAVAVIQIAAEHGAPLLPRAAGTSLAGQCVGEGVIVDMGRYQNAIIEFDPGIRRVTVQPGIVRDVLNRHLAPHGLLFAPDPSSTDQCQIGGMLGNNAWGLHALHDGTTRDHVVGIEAILADASLIRLNALNATALQEKSALQGREGEIYRAVTDTISQHAQAITDGYPSTRGIPSNAGYALDVLLRGQPWTGSGPRFNLASLLCGAEGTLALITAVTLKLTERPAARCLLCMHYNTVESALQSVAALRATQPSALELLDRAILRVAATDSEQKTNRFWLQGDPGAVLIVEYSGTAETVNAACTRTEHEFRGRPCTRVEAADIEGVWALRRAALRMLMAAGGRFQAVTGIEDAAVAVAELPAYYAEVRALLESLALPFFAYGPVGMGSLHVRPVLRLDSAAAVGTYERLLDEIAAITVRFCGSFSAKHGDGRMRGKYLETVLGADVLRALHSVKCAFDPLGILNPGKILDCPPLTADLAVS